MAVKTITNTVSKSMRIKKREKQCLKSLIVKNERPRKGFQKAEIYFLSLSCLEDFYDFCVNNHLMFLKTVKNKIEDSEVLALSHTIHHSFKQFYEKREMKKYLMFCI